MTKVIDIVLAYVFLTSDTIEHPVLWYVLVDCYNFIFITSHRRLDLMLDITNTDIAMCLD